jgi:hypothetical protein
MVAAMFVVAAVHAAAKQELPAPAFLPEHGFFDAPVAVSLSASKPNAKIYATTNGAVPSLSSGFLFTRAIRLESTTILRAVVLDAQGEALSPVKSQTYLFTRDVLKQTGAGWPATWGSKNGKPVPVDYEMDPKIVNHADYRDMIERALKSIPTLSIVMERDDLFGEKRGIYVHAEETGADWERPASVELIYADGRKGFDVNCGIRIQGGWNRRPEESPKHAFRLVFKRKYGVAPFQFSFFGEGVTEFETLILRAGNNNSWLHWSGEERHRADFVRDQWMRDSMRAMGHPSARGFFAHLYLNGLYWGLYNVCERPSAPFLAAHFGGKPKDYDSRNADKVLEGDKKAFDQMLALANRGLQGQAEYRAMQDLLDVPSFIDFMIVNLYGANADWDRSSNWYAGRRRSPPAKFQFFIWDGERTLERVEDNTINFDDDQSPPRLFQKLRANTEFRVQFAEQARRHLTDHGALTPARAADRFRLWATNIEDAVVCESARWGDYRRNVHPYKTGPYEIYTRNEHWRPEIDRLLRDYFPKRTSVLIEQFRESGLYQ